MVYYRVCGFLSQEVLLLWLFNKDWVGVGFSDYGSLPGADLCVFWRDWTGQIFFTDVSVTADGLIKGIIYKILNGKKCIKNIDVTGCFLHKLKGTGNVFF